MVQEPNRAADSAPDTAPANGVVVVDGTRYAVGLMWQPLQNPDNPMPEIREALENEPGADLYCLRTSATPQYGVGKTRLGHASGIPSLAAAVASALSDKTSGCGVFKVPEGWWFIAIRNDLILAEEDILFPTEDEAKRAFFSMMAVPNWDIRIVPADWNIEGSTQTALEDLIRNIRKTRLTEINTAKRTRILIVIALVIILILGALIYGIYSLLQLAFKQENILDIPSPEVARQAAPTPEKEKPWEKVVKVDAFLSRCWNNAYQLSSLTVPGWRLGMVSCTPKGITTSWSKAWDRGGRAAWLRAAMAEYKLNTVSINIASSGTSASGSVAFSDIPFVSSTPSLSVAEIQQDLTEISLATAIPIRFSQQTLLIPPNDAEGKAPPNQQTYYYFSFSVSSPYSPWEWETFFNKFSGLELLKIEFDPTLESQNKWKYEGRIYAK